MKVKRRPEDFVVEELTRLKPGSTGDYALYRLRKQGIGTLEALREVQRQWKLGAGRIDRGGLKDRHAVTTQYVTIAHGRHEDLRQSTWQLEYLGQVPKRYSADAVIGNRFTIVLRSMTEQQVSDAKENLAAIAEFGVPNYFDDQRFGSVTVDGSFAGAAWIANDFEAALRLTFATYHPGDRLEEREQQAILQEHWGDWKECKRLLSRSHRRSIITFLDDRPGDFKGAWARVDRDYRSLLLSAFQSEIWNQTLAETLRTRIPEECLTNVLMKTGPLPFYNRMGAATFQTFENLQIVLPSGRVKLESIPDVAVREALVSVLASWGLTLPQMKVKTPRDCFFSRAMRPAILRPGKMTWDIAEDELQPGRAALSLSFDLPPGAYATMLIKRISRVASDSDDDVDDDFHDEETDDPLNEIRHSTEEPENLDRTDRDRGIRDEISGNDGSTVDSPIRDDGNDSAL
ncbi:MAG: tRNA pseudouridine(13) synthase TruD [Planctomycetaceae bacterium]